MAKGNVKWFNRAKGYGFIEPEDGTNDVFVHITAVQNAGLITLFQGQVISYDVQLVNDERIAASNVVILVDVSDAVKSGEAFQDTQISSVT
jgi:CspA family cold shock protein